jgi:hypothetical protein
MTTLRRVRPAQRFYTFLSIRGTGLGKCGYGLPPPRVLRIASRSTGGMYLELAGWWLKAVASSGDALAARTRLAEHYALQAMPDYNQTNNQATIIVVHGHGGNMGRVTL